MAEIDVYIIADDQFDLTMALDAKLTWGDVGVQNVRDMVSKILKMTSQGDRIRELRIVGHGNESGQYIGADWISLDTIDIYRSQLVRIAPFFALKANVIMGGCRMGRNGGLLLKLSEIFNVPVSGFTAFQRPALPGDEGGRTTCYITCTREGKTTADSFDEYQEKFMNYIQRIFE